MAGVEDIAAVDEAFYAPDDIGVLPELVVEHAIEHIGAVGVHGVVDFHFAGV